ncbi:hypothetical protein [Ellagibacter isourolithinifaciens]|uniref:hypothetical protein n=1 Tax=Ellagibacter isourolithinifaciens TaxID=2137581 RepID=UPI001478C7DC|nr:hypothetical protein [Ellagibacter isourolithinifaciens]
MNLNCAASPSAEKKTLRSNWLVSVLSAMRLMTSGIWQVCMTMHGKRRIGVGALRGPLGGFRNIDNLIALVMLRCSSLSITLPGRG